MDLIGQLITLDESFATRKVVRQGGKSINRRLKFSKSKSVSFNNATGQTRRITASDRAKMSRAQKIAAKKRQSGRSMANMKRQKSMRMRKSLGFDR